MRSCSGWGDGAWEAGLGCAELGAEGEGVPGELLVHDAVVGGKFAGLRDVPALFEVGKEGAPEGRGGRGRGRGRGDGVEIPGAGGEEGLAFGDDCSGLP